MIFDTTNITQIVDTIQGINRLIDTVNVNVIDKSNPINQFLPLIYTVSGVVLGVLLGLIRDWYKISRKFKSTRQYFFYSIVDLRTSVKEQIKLYKEFIDQVKSEDNNIPSLPINMGFTTRSINAVSSGDLFKILVTKADKSNKDYVTDLRVLLKGFNKIEGIVNRNEKDNETIQNSIKRCMDKFGNLLQKLLQDNIRLQNDYRNITDEKTLKILDLINDVVTENKKHYRDDTDTPATTHYNRFIEPLRKILKDNDSDVLLPQVGAVTHSYFELKTNRVNIVNKFTRDLKDLEEVVLVIINSIVEKYKDYLDEDLVSKEEELTKLRNT